jgi:phosphohistidine phosphatase SixA
MNVVRLKAIAALVFLVVPLSTYAQKTVILVRHADRDGGADRLNPEGRDRALALACTLRNSGITAIVRSNTDRTKATAEPTANQFNITPNIVSYDSVPLDVHVKNALKAIRTSGENDVLLYVGHSDTLEPLLREFGYKGLFSLKDPYGNLFIVIPKGQDATVTWLHYSSKGGDCGAPAR